MDVDDGQGAARKAVVEAQIEEMVTSSAGSSFPVTRERLIESWRNIASCDPEEGGVDAADVLQARQLLKDLNESY